MILNIPFTIGQTVWVWENHPTHHTIEVPDGWDHLGPKSKYETIWKDHWYATPKFFHFALLDKYNLKDIFLSAEACKIANQGIYWGE